MKSNNTKKSNVNRFSRFSFNRSKLIALAVVVATFAGAGTFYINQSMARPEGNCKSRTFRPGQNRGHSCVKAIQAFVKVKQDGIYGNGTRNAVAAYQRSVGIGADGVVGPQTWRQMCRFPGSFGNYSWACTAR